MTTNELKAYCFGFFDGEGTVTITRNRRKPGAPLDYRVQINASQKETPPLEILKSMYGGSIHLITRRGIRTTHMWSLGGKAKQILFLTDGLSYLHCKRTEAEIALQFLQRVVRDQAGGMNIKQPEVLKLREELFLKSLNIRRVRKLMPDHRGQCEFPMSVGITADPTKK